MKGRLISEREVFERLQSPNIDALNLIRPTVQRHERVENHPDIEVVLEMSPSGILIKNEIEGKASDVDYAEKFSEQIGPRVVNLTDNTHVPNGFFPGWTKKKSNVGVGCQGDGKHQYAVAAFLKDFLKKHPELNCRYVINTGDNFYDSGIPSPFDPNFNVKFYNPYDEGLPWFMSFGNHCYNFHNLEEAKEYVRPITQPLRKAAKALNSNVDTSLPPKGKAAARNQTTHALYYHPEDPKLKKEKADLYKQAQMDVKEASKFDLPYYFSSKIDGQFQYFFVDTNTLLMDAWEYYNWIGSDGKTPIKKNNQIIFLEREYAECKKAGRIPIRIDHHPDISLNKRAFHYDSELYTDKNILRVLDLIFQLPRDDSFKVRLKQILRCSPEFLYKIPGLPFPTVDYKNHNTMLLRFFATFGMDFALHMCAHDHMLAYIDVAGLPNVSWNFDPRTSMKFKSPDRPDDLSHYHVCQVTTGGGGGTIHPRKWFDLGNAVGCVGERNGFVILTRSENRPEVEIHYIMYKSKRYKVRNANGEEEERVEQELDSHLRFLSGNPEPIIEYGPPIKEYIDGKEIKHPASYITPLEKIEEKNRLIQEGKLQLTEDELKFKELRAIILQASRKYQKFLQGKMMETRGGFLDVGGNATHFQSDVTVMHNMMNYVNHYKARPYDEAVKVLYETSLKFVNGGGKFNVVNSISSLLWKGKQPEGSDNSLNLEINRLLRESAILGKKSLTELYESLGTRNSLRI